MNDLQRLEQLIAAEDIQDLAQLIGIACVNPGMFGAFTSLDPIEAFVRGFAAGRGSGFPEELTEFQEWFAEEAYRLYRIPRSQGWAVSLLSIYKDVDTATRELPGIYRNYKNGEKLKLYKQTN